MLERQEEVELVTFLVKIALMSQVLDPITIITNKGALWLKQLKNQKIKSIYKCTVSM